MALVSSMTAAVSAATLFLFVLVQPAFGALSDRIGRRPLLFAFSLVGSGLGKGNLATTLTQLLAAMAVINIAAWLVYRVMKKQKTNG